MKILIILCLLLCSVVANKPRLWTRIPQFYVDDRVKYFIKNRGINDCFEFKETEDNLLLKCWRNNKLTDVSIMIEPGKQKKRYEFSGISISI